MQHLYIRYENRRRDVLSQRHYSLHTLDALESAGCVVINVTPKHSSGWCEDCRCYY